MAQQLNSINYATINDDINTLLTSGAYSGVNVSVFTDANKTQIFSDSQGPVQSRVLSQITHTGTYTNAEGQDVPPSVSIIFADGTTVTAVDGIDNLWYSLTGIVFQPRRF
jgi:hypothetical protein